MTPTSSMWTARRYGGRATAASARALYIKLSDEIGTWAGDITEADLPDPFYVDYVRVYDLTEE